jgi:hypothetical protein
MDSSPKEQIQPLNPEIWSICMVGKGHHDLVGEGDDLAWLFWSCEGPESDTVLWWKQYAVSRYIWKWR